MTNKSSESTRYMIQVGTNRFRRDTWDSMKDICAIEGTRFSDEIWAALDMHVKNYSSAQKKELVDDGRVMMDKTPAHVVDDVGGRVAHEAHEEEGDEEVEANEAEDTGRRAEEREARRQSTERDNRE